MQRTGFASIVVSTLLLAVSYECSATTLPFVDGRWSGGIRPVSGEAKALECWAKTGFHDGTSFSLVVREDHVWFLRLSNSTWQLPPSHIFAMEALVDFYPRYRVSAVANSATLLEIADLDEGPLLGNIENGHTIDLFSDGFNAKYELEGSAKIIQRLRNCLVDLRIGKQ
ncbi:MAG: hypothetical protein R3D32_00100 [Nitratireductor sp.]